MAIFDHLMGVGQPLFGLEHGGGYAHPISNVWDRKAQMSAASWIRMAVDSPACRGRPWSGCG